MRLVTLLLLVPLLSIAQIRNNFPQQQVSEELQKAWEEYTSGLSIMAPSEGSKSNFHSGIYHFLQQQKGRGSEQLSNLKSQTILYVGLTPNDTLRVTGAWHNSGPVFVINNGVLIFDHAQATIEGFLLVAGTGHIIATNSSFYFPQQYFYEWGLQAAQHGQMYMRKCSLDFAGLAHSIGISDSATIIQQNVYFSDDNTTTGLNNHATYVVDTANLLGEIVATDSVQLTLQNVDTVIVWHRVAQNQGLTWTFPSGINLQHYALGPDSPGVMGIQYHIEVDNIKLLNWALMPENNSTVSISNSTIRSVGVIFKGRDSANVQGLVDNSTYSSASNLLNDRNFQLINCSVETWGLYPTDTAKVNISSCITGEIGTGGMAHTSCSSSFSDGTGGYFWGNGKGFQTASGCGFRCPVRSEQSSIVLVAFGSIAAATGYAVDSSILFLVQTPTLSPPIAYGGSDVWVGTLAPQTANTGDDIALTGSAYILRGPTSHLMSFASYYVAYQIPGSSEWIIIGNASTTPVNQNALANWNTTGLAPGNYPLILVIKDNYGDSITVNSAITLQTVGTGISFFEQASLSVYPNPAYNQFSIKNERQLVKEVRLLNILGQTIFISNIVDAPAFGTFNMDISTVPPGIYIYRVYSENCSVKEGKLVKL